MAPTITHAHGTQESFPGTSERIKQLLKPRNCSTQWTMPPHYPLKLIEVTYAIGAGCRMNQIKLSLERSYICINQDFKKDFDNSKPPGWIVDEFMCRKNSVLFIIIHKARLKLEQNQVISAVNYFILTGTRYFLHLICIYVSRWCNILKGCIKVKVVKGWCKK